MKTFYYPTHLGHITPINPIKPFSLIVTAMQLEKIQPDFLKLEISNYIEDFNSEFKKITNPSKSLLLIKEDVKEMQSTLPYIHKMDANDLKEFKDTYKLISKKADSIIKQYKEAQIEANRNTPIANINSSKIQRNKSFNSNFFQDQANNISSNSLIEKNSIINSQNKITGNFIP